MTENNTVRVLKNQPGTGFAALILCFAASMILWPLCSTVAQALFSALASQGLAAAGPLLAGKLVGAMVEGSFFWMVINTWIWLTLIMGNYGKTRFTEQQPLAGLS
ncbi:MAG: hypothetical protein WCG31_00120 [Deltaproteobacteria bacterium]